MGVLSPRRASALLWGVVGALAFLVVHGAYLLSGGAFLGVGPIAGVACAVFAATALGSYYAERRFGPFAARFGGR
ncbi:MAG: hypothetical protein RI560_06795 [Natronomonas sp.]|jgi:polyferredoxin|uniref:DUF7981 domain-containing protein n=1 Tax=Natronomonas salsuginis TaxID=2217661 RepID=A0A4V5ZNC5_9EURY|nr:MULTISPECIES: hypothetical protein [Natronomonas]MDR9381363.1 hypothetical protein [Natronomonas sp.]MDR9429380.1 hypothetical protein [Natronomonas sp.]TKR24793.1 hypothetical protein DM868_12695 [Natronomonas salsuginis]